MLELKNITIAYNDKPAVNNASFVVNTGEIVCIVGESGSGKTSIIRSIMNILPSNAKISNGDILYNGVSQIENKGYCKDFSIVFQDTRQALNPVRKIKTQFIEYIRKHTDLSKQQAYSLAVDTLKNMNLSESVMSLYTFQLSGGMMQRVGLAFSLSLNPKLLLLDEPTSALDVTTQSQVIDNIIELKEKYDTTILMITHNIPLAIYIADKIIVMKNGEIVEENLSYKILNEPKHEYTQKLIQNIPKLKEN